MIYLDPKGPTTNGSSNGLAPCATSRVVPGPVNSKPNGLVKTLTPAMVLFVALLYASAGLAEENFAPGLSGKLKSLGAEESFVYTSLYTTHYDPDPDHVNDQNMLGFENTMGRDRIWGLAMFDNSFGQESQYLYVGQKWRAFESDQWYYKLTGGLLHGYEEPYEDKIPLNDLGIAPAIVPALGYRNKSFFAEFSQLGLAAGMVTVGFAF